MEMDMAMAPDAENHRHEHEHQPLMQMANGKSRKKKTLSLETYLAFLHSRDVTKFTTDHLNLIMSIHGYRKLAKRKKAEEAVRGIEPMNPARTTLNDEVFLSSGKATIKFMETIKDLRSLNWQECSIISTVSINPEDYNTVNSATKVAPLKAGKKMHRLTSSTSSGSGSSGGYSIVPVLPSKTATMLRTLKPMKRRRLDFTVGNGDISNSGSSGHGCVSSALDGTVNELGALVCLGAAAYDQSNY